MAVGDILAAIRTEAEADIAQVRADADARVASILDRSREEAEAAERTAASARDAAAEREYSRVVNRARLVADQAVRRAAERVYQHLLERVVAGVVATRGSPRYRQLLVDFFEEVMALLPQARRIQVDEADAATMEEILRSAELDDFTVEPSIATAGGLVLATDDGRAINNTIESRIHRADLILRQLAGELVPPIAGGAR